MSRHLLCLLVGLAIAACNVGTSPQLQVLDVDKASADEVVFIQVTNPARQVMRLTKLVYTFAADGTTVSTGELALARDVPAGSAVVVEIPLDAHAAAANAPRMTLEGELTARLDQIVRVFRVSAQIRPH
jgi:hypothetical protein